MSAKTFLKDKLTEITRSAPASETQTIAVDNSLVEKYGVTPTNRYRP